MVVFAPRRVTTYFEIKRGTGERCVRLSIIHGREYPIVIAEPRKRLTRAKRTAEGTIVLGERRGTGHRALYPACRKAGRQSFLD